MKWNIIGNKLYMKINKFFVDVLVYNDLISTFP